MKTKLTKSLVALRAALFAFIAMASIVLLNPMTAFALDGDAPSSAPVDTTTVTRPPQGESWAFWFILGLLIIGVIVAIVLFVVHKSKKNKQSVTNAVTQGADTAMNGLGLVRNPVNNTYGVHTPVQVVAPQAATAIQFGQINQNAPVNNNPPANNNPPQNNNNGGNNGSAWY
jgi:hypothetical protein